MSTQTTTKPSAFKSSYAYNSSNQQASPFTRQVGRSQRTEDLQGSLPANSAKQVYTRTSYIPKAEEPHIFPIDQETGKVLATAPCTQCGKSFAELYPNHNCSHAPKRSSAELFAMAENALKKAKEMKEKEDNEFLE